MAHNLREIMEAINGFYELYAEDENFIQIDIMQQTLEKHINSLGPELDKLAQFLQQYSSSTVSAMAPKSFSIFVTNLSALVNNFQKRGILIRGLEDPTALLEKISLSFSGAQEYPQLEKAISSIKLILCNSPPTANASPKKITKRLQHFIPDANANDNSNNTGYDDFDRGGIERSQEEFQQQMQHKAYIDIVREYEKKKRSWMLSDLTTLRAEYNKIIKVLKKKYNLEEENNDLQNNDEVVLALLREKAEYDQLGIIELDIEALMNLQDILVKTEEAATKLAKKYDAVINEEKVTFTKKNVLADGNCAVLSLKCSREDILDMKWRDIESIKLYAETQKIPLSIWQIDPKTMQLKNIYSSSTPETKKSKMLHLLYDGTDHFDILKKQQHVTFNLEDQRSINEKNEKRPSNSSIIRSISLSLKREWQNRNLPLDSTNTGEANLLKVEFK